MGFGFGGLGFSAQSLGVWGLRMLGPRVRGVQCWGIRGFRGYGSTLSLGVRVSVFSDSG